MGRTGKRAGENRRFLWCFILIADYEDSCEVSLIGLSAACIVGAFVIEMLYRGYYFIMESLVQHGW